MKTSLRTMSALALAIATASGGAYAAQLEEVIVTAQKRAESLQDVPISMTAIAGEKIQEASIQSMTDLGAYVPNLSITENAVNSIISMRGIGVGANQSFEQSVGVYVDGIHYGKSRHVRTGLFDLGQVEVLRGPQGILFGKNTLAGAINVTSASANIGDEMSGPHLTRSLGGVSVNLFVLCVCVSEGAARREGTTTTALSSRAARSAVRSYGELLLTTRSPREL